MARKKSAPTAEPVHTVPPAVFSFLVELSRLLIAGGISANALKELAMRAHVQAAREATYKVGRKPNKALIAAMTGLSRVEVNRLLTVSVIRGDQPLPSASRATRVLDGWRGDAEFIDARGEPVALPVRGHEHSFEVLVRRYSGDMTPQAMLRELLRLELVEVEDGKVRPVKDPVGNHHLRTLDALIQGLQPVLKSVSADKSHCSDVHASTIDVSTSHPVNQKLLLKHLKAAVPRFLEAALATAEALPPTGRERGKPSADHVSISVIVTDTKTLKTRSRP